MRRLVVRLGPCRNLFEKLRSGLHAAGSVAGGTAYGQLGDRAGAALRVMPNGERRLFVKTGTATYRAVDENSSRVRTYFSLWLAGWIEGIEGSPIPQRLAFACMITRGTNSETGGRTCARLVRG